MKRSSVMGGQDMGKRRGAGEARWRDGSNEGEGKSRENQRREER